MLDFVTLIGLLIGLAGLVGGFLLEGGHATMLVAGAAAVIVFGGTAGAVIISFTQDELKTIPHFLRVIFVNKPIDYVSSIDILVDTANIARREGILSLDKKLGEIENPFLARGLQLIVDGTDPELTRNMLEMEIEAYETKEKVGHDIFMSAGGFAPTMGIIGTVMGLVHILSSIEDPDALAGAIAMAFLAALYGVASANVIFIPFATKIKVKTEKKVVLMELILEGILSIQAGDNPRVIKEKLMTFLPPDVKYKVIEQERAEIGM